MRSYPKTKRIENVDLQFDFDGNLVSINGSPILLNNKISQDNISLLRKIIYLL